MARRSTIKRWKRRKQRGQPAEVGLDEKDVERIVRDSMLVNPPALPKALRVGSIEADELTTGQEWNLDPSQTLQYTQPGFKPQIIRVYEDFHWIDPTWGHHEDEVPDGMPPDTPMLMTLRSTKSAVFLRWDEQIHPSIIHYQVYVDTSPGFTPTDNNLVAETMGTMIYLKGLADGTPFDAATTYYFQVIARDVDGESGASNELFGTIDPEGTGDLLVGTITAEQLEAQLVLTTTLIAGAGMEGARVEIGVSEHDDQEMVGIHAFNMDNELTFMLDAMTGDVFVRGTIQFGMSFLRDNGIIELQAQPTSGVYSPTRVQSAMNSGLDKTTATVTWPFSTQNGSLLLLALLVWDADGTVPTPSTPAGWTLVGEIPDAATDSRLLLWKIANSAPRSGVQSITLNDTVHYIAHLHEYFGVATQDVYVEDTKTSILDYGTSSVGADTVEANELWFAVGGLSSSTTTFGTTQEDSGGAFDFITSTALTDTSPARRLILESWESTANATGDPGIDVEFNPAPANMQSTVIIVTFRPVAVAGIPGGEDGILRVYAQDNNGQGQLWTTNDAGHVHQMGGPTGMITPFGGSAAPNGWFICDGTAVSRTTYAALFDVIGTQFGGGDGSTTFNIPNIKGRVPVGIDAGQTEFDTRGETGGAKTHVLVNAEMPSHAHGAGSYQVNLATQGNTTATGGAQRVTGGGADISPAVTGNSGTAGSDNAHNNLQPYIALHYIIKY